MRFLIDCDVTLEVVLDRADHYDDSAALLDWAEQHPGEAAVAWHTFSNLFYLCERSVRPFVEDALNFLEAPATGTDSMRIALETGIKDLEDAMQVAAADQFRAQAIATRNLRAYRKSPIKAMTPSGLLALLQN